MHSTSAQAPILLIGSEKYLSATDTAEELGISRQRTNILIRSGKLQSTQVNGRYYVTLSSIEARKARP